MTSLPQHHFNLFLTQPRDWMMQPIHERLANGPQHRVRLPGPWDIERLQEAFADRLLRSARRLPTGQVAPGSEEAQDLLESVDLLISLDSGFLYIDHNWAVGVGETPEDALAVLETVRSYRGKAKPKPAGYQLIKYADQEFDSETVPLQRSEEADSEQLRLQYGDDFPEWHAALLAQYEERSNGIAILQGPPGTGKTSYLRLLMHTLHESHRFYFLPSSNLNALRDGAFVQFWADERQVHRDKRFVVIVEDAESALMPRNHGNRQEVAVLLNITDGMLGDFLRLQVVCTVNCELADLDQALLRPGRLITRRHFGPIPAERARQLARSIGRSLPGNRAEYTLAEIYSGQIDPTLHSHRSMGFHTSTPSQS